MGFKELVSEDMSSEPRGPLVVIRGYREGGVKLTFNGPGNKTEEKLENGLVIEGIYEGAKVEKTPKGKESIEYKIRAENDTLYMIKGCSSLNNRQTGLAAVNEGTLVQVTFEKMITTKSGNDFAVFRVATADEAAND
jgi:hypothetical protein